MTTTSTLRGFGFTFERDRARHWYIDSEGIKRWADTDKAVEAVNEESDDDV